MTVRHIACVLAIVLLSPPARADEDDLRADVLFTQARELMERGAFAEACPLLEESERLDPGLGTRLNLALCYKGLGRLASAAALYRKVQAEAEAAQDERAEVARTEAMLLASRVPRMEVRASGAPPGIKILVAGQPFADSWLAVPAEHDPGPIMVSASAPGYRDFERMVTLREGVTEVVNVTLVPIAVPPPPPPGNPRGRTQRLLAYAAGGTGILLIGVGSAFGLRAQSRWSDAKKICPNAICETETQLSASKSRTDAARDAATLSTVTFIAGGALLAGGIVLYLTAPRGREPSIAPALGPGSAGLIYQGIF